MKKVALALVLVFMVTGLAWGADKSKRELAIDIVELQADINSLTKRFQDEQQAYAKLRDETLKQADHAKKGEMAEQVLAKEKELNALAERINKKAAELQKAKDEYDKLVTLNKSVPEKK